MKEPLVVLRGLVPDVFRYVCEDYAALKAECRGPRPGTSYQTPTPPQFLVMLRNRWEMYGAARKAPQAAARDNTRDTDAR